MNPVSEVAVFGGGCFWCTEAIFKGLKGVMGVTPGYAGGTKKNPTYERISSGESDHAEAIKIVFDPAVISYRDLLTVFFATHDPTSMNRQGNDTGPQYRSLILYADAGQKSEAETFIKELDEGDPPSPDGLRRGKVVTRVEPIGEFYEAEEYHRDYYRKNRKAPYCEIVINPKLEKLKERFGQLLAS